MTVNVPTSTIDKPLTAIDYIAAMDACSTHVEVGKFCDQVPLSVRNDERFGKAVAAKLAAIKESRPERKRA